MPSISRARVAIVRTLVAGVVLVSASFISTTPVQAQRVAIAGQVGTTGLGGGVVVGLMSKINVRAMYGIVPGDPSFNIDDIDFAFDFPSYFLATVDLYPVGGFHFSAGGLLISNDGNLDVTGSFDGRSVTIGSTVYTGGADDLLIGSFSLKHFQPYVGIGIGNPLGKRIGINFDAGVGFGERPTVDLTAQGPLADAPGSILQSELDQEEADIEADIPNWLKYYPVLSLSISIAF